MAAFTYQHQHPHFHLDSLFINPIYFPSMPVSSSVLQIDNAQQIGEKIEPFMSDHKTKQTSTTDTPTSSIVVDLEGDDQVIHSQDKTTPSMEKRKSKNGSCFDSDKDVKQRSKPKKQRKCDLEVKEEKKSKVDNKKKKKNGVKAAVVLTDHKQTDYVHVRARRGQANDRHSLAERVRREKISERLKRLQSLVPGCDQVNSKAHMLDEIINYVQSLQVQVEMLSMKLAYMNPVFYDFGVDLDDFFPKPTLAATSSPLPLTTTHQDSMTHAPTTTSSTTTPTEFANANVTPTFSSTTNSTSAIPLHENSVSFSPLQREVHQQKLNDFSRIPPQHQQQQQQQQQQPQQQQQQQQEVPNNEEVLCYMDYYHLHRRQEGATNLFYYE